MKDIDSPAHVRQATEADAPAIADIQARNMNEALSSFLGDATWAHSILAQALDPQKMTEQWQRSLLEPPKDTQGVFVAALGPQIVGFLAFTPANVDQHLDEEHPLSHLPAEVEISALEVSQEYGRQGHASRLMAAVTETLRQRGISRIQTWVLQGAQPHIRFLTQVGFAPAGLRRGFEVGDQQLFEMCWYTNISEGDS
ncbi:MAG: GNAT family N-acetyltransferase [Actinomycetaceae bacterium]|nr:GNAT family N-acetyltransferase [Actinomycetaceae bacterium]